MGRFESPNGAQSFEAEDRRDAYPTRHSGGSLRFQHMVPVKHCSFIAM